MNNPFKSFSHNYLIVKWVLQEWLPKNTVEACTGQHETPMAGGARCCWLFIDAVCATAVAAVTTICEGVTMVRDKPVIAASM
jgi:hypothetical protein